MREITIQLTERCNLACPYCFAGSKSGAEISGDDLNFFVDFCAKNAVESMMFSDFRRCIEKMSAQFYLVVYSNFTVQDMIRSMNLRGRDLIFLVNINQRENYTAAQWQNESALCSQTFAAFAGNFQRFEREKNS